MSKSKNVIGVFVFSYYLQDTRVIKQCEALTNNGRSVRVYCLRRKDEPKNEVRNGVEIYRFNFDGQDKTRTKKLYAFLTLRFMIYALITNIFRIKIFDIIIIHNMPNYLVISALINRFFGAKVIIDCHDLMPEVLLADNKNNVKWVNKVLYSILCMEERLSHRLATSRITVNRQVADYLSNRNKLPYTVIHNGPLVVPDSKKDNDVRRTSLVFVGNIHARYGLDNVIKALPLVLENKPDLTLDIYGDGPHGAKLKSLVQELDIAQTVLFHGRYNPDQLPNILAKHSIGVATLVKCKQNDLAIPVKATEYIASGTPFICSDLDTVKFYFQDFGIEYVNYEDPSHIAKGIIKMINGYEEYRENLTISMQNLEKISWVVEGEKFVNNIIR